MLFGRFFVTSVLILATALAIGCHNKKDKRGDLSSDQKQALLKEGEDISQAMEGLRKSLDTDFHIVIDTVETPKVLVNLGGKSHLKLGPHFNWSKLTRAQRQSAKEKLADFNSKLSRMIAIDSKKGVYVTNIEKVQYYLEQGTAFMDSLSVYEKTNGEQFESKTAGEGDSYLR